MAKPALTSAMVQQILISEQNDSRFERFCIELFSEYDSTDYVPTSASWDLGRDGTPATLLNRSDLPIMCCTLSQRVSPKALKDIKRLQKTTQPRAVRFCSNQPLSESARDAIKRECKRSCRSLESIEVEGCIQISSIVTRDERYANVFEGFYSGEVANQRLVLADDDGDGTAYLSGMRIALTTQLTDDASALRQDLTQNIVLTALSDRRSRTVPEIGREISKALHLGRTVDNAYVLPVLKFLERRRLVNRSGNERYTITEGGSKAVVARGNQGAEVLAEGQRLVRESITKLSGHELNDPEFASVWRLIQDELSEMLYLNGMQIIDALAALAEPKGSPVAQELDLKERIDRLASNVSAILHGTPRAQDIAQAVSDLFHDRTSPAFDWLTRMCVAYVAACALGLSPDAQNAIVARLRRLDLLLETDIVLSFLSEGEPDYVTLQQVFAGWRKAGGRIYVAAPVLEETAYHAHISDNDSSGLRSVTEV